MDDTVQKIHWLGVGAVFVIIAVLAVVAIVTFGLILLMAGIAAVMGCVMAGLATAMYEPLQEGWHALQRYAAKRGVDLFP